MKLNIILLLTLLSFISCKKESNKNITQTPIEDIPIEEDSIDESIKDSMVVKDPYETTFDTILIENDGKKIREIHITDHGYGVGNVTFVKENIYILNQQVYVNSSQELTINPGTIIKGAVGQNENSSALIVAKGGKIMAEGTKNEPIIFTSIHDKSFRDINGIFNQEYNMDSDYNEYKGYWGGLIILGNGILNEPEAGSLMYIEGVTTTDPRNLYGGSNNQDNSGILKYVSIRFGGSEIGAGNEINGLTLGGVGSGTEIDYIEIIANKDDGIEFFGGAAHIKHAVVYNCGDDAFDWDQGFVGKGQFLLAINPGDKAFECDGDDTPGSTPYAKPTVSNITIIGNTSTRYMFVLRQNSGGYIWNMLAYDFKNAIRIQNMETPDALNRFESSDGKLKYIYFSKVESDDNALVVSYDFYDEINQSSNSNIIDNSENDPSDWNLSITKLAVNKKGVTPSDVWFTKADYAGAFDPNAENGNWLRGWTYLDNKGLLD